jgi:hypothetical protein
MVLRCDARKRQEIISLFFVMPFSDGRGEPDLL